LSKMIVVRLETSASRRICSSGKRARGKPARPRINPVSQPPHLLERRIIHDDDAPSIIYRQDPKPPVIRPRRIRIAPAERVVPRRPVIARRGAVANVPVAALPTRAKGAAVVAAAVVVVVAAACVDGDVAAASGAVAVAERRHCGGLWAISKGKDVCC